ncbi:MAG: PAS domain S-box protein [Desulfuromonadaceae bacterium]|nr:PAS domain S-box protein [Desulfuromonadaceae bacterium]
MTGKTILDVNDDTLLDNREELIRLREEHRLVSEKLHHSEKKFRMLFEHSADPSLLISGNRFIDCNEATVKMLRAATREDILNTYPSMLSPEIQPDGRRSSEKADEMIAMAVRNGSHCFEWLHRRKDGELFPAEVTLTLIEESGETELYTVWRDITERKQREDALCQEQLFSNTLLESLPGICYLYSYPELKLLRWNRQHESLLGYGPGEIEGRYITEWHVPEAKEAVLAAIETVMTTGQSSIEAPLLTKTGDLVYFFLTGVKLENQGKLYLLGTGIDISERKRAEHERLELEKQILHAQKLESLGVLAGGIAHDFNNILTAIIGNANLALIRVNKESPAVENLLRIEQAAARAADLAKQMLAYSGKGKFVVESINLNTLLEEMLHMLEVSISKKAIMRLNPNQHLPSVKADATQVRQIIMNLVINASEAIGDKSGVIAITTGCTYCDRNYLKNVWLDENLADGLYAYLEIADTGCGMDHETLTKLFDPFFTTKFTGRGLGMAAVLGIVRGHKGAIKVYSEPGKGSSFKILLPASGHPAELRNDAGHSEEFRGSGTVLLVDDEEIIRGIGAEMLKELGFSTITASDGREAVETFRNSSDISFVILDLTMPHMDGEQCFRELRQLNPDIRVIMSSGFNEQEVTQKFIGKGLAGFIQKPYKLSTLREVFREFQDDKPSL